MGKYIFLIVVGMCGIASAQTPSARTDVAREFFLKGTQQFAAHNYILAAQDFENSYELVRAPEILLNAAMCWERVGDEAHSTRAYWNATNDYLEYLDTFPAAADVATARRHLADVSRKLLALPAQRAGIVPSFDEPDAGSR